MVTNKENPEKEKIRVGGTSFNQGSSFCHSYQHSGCNLTQTAVEEEVLDPRVRSGASEPVINHQVIGCRRIIKIIDWLGRLHASSRVLGSEVKAVVLPDYPSTDAITSPDPITAWWA